MATTAFAYICFCMFILFSVALVIFQGAVSDELGIGEGRSHACWGGLAGSRPGCRALAKGPGNACMRCALDIFAQPRNAMFAPRRCTE